MKLRACASALQVCADDPAICCVVCCVGLYFVHTQTDIIASIIGHFQPPFDVGFNVGTLMHMYEDRRGKLHHLTQPCLDLY